ncbi:hypothetical protein PTKIN_Ptkin04bG0049400 [Pterospermum kingtungense]
METLIDGEMRYERDEDVQSESDPASVEHGLESLEYLSIYYMKNLRSFWRSPITMDIIKAECQWWEDLNWNETEWGNRPDYLMSIFSRIDNKKDVITELAEDRGILETMIEDECQQPGYTKDRTTGTDVISRSTSFVFPYFHPFQG